MRGNLEVPYRCICVLFNQEISQIMTVSFYSRPLFRKIAKGVIKHEGRGGGDMLYPGVPTCTCRYWYGYFPLSPTLLVQWHTVHTVSRDYMTIDTVSTN